MSIPLGTFPLVVNQPISINCFQNGGVVELVNPSPYDCNIVSQAGNQVLQAGFRAGYSNGPFGSTFSVLPQAPTVQLQTSTLQFQAFWYAPGEMEPYPPQAIGNLVSSPAQGGAGTSIVPTTDTSFASGGTLNLGNSPGLTLYLFGFDVTGQASPDANVHVSSFSISGLVNPATGSPFPQNLSFFATQTPSQGFITLSPRFPQAFQSAKGAGITISKPSLPAGCTAIFYLANY